MRCYRKRIKDSTDDRSAIAADLSSINRMVLGPVLELPGGNQVNE